MSTLKIISSYRYQPSLTQSDRNRIWSTVRKNQFYREDDRSTRDGRMQIKSRTETNEKNEKDCIHLNISQEIKSFWTQPMRGY